MNGVFRFNDAHDRESASDGVSRYGYYLRQRQDQFADWDDPQAVTVDPVVFTQLSWEIANSPTMSPPYLDWQAERVQSVTCTGSEYDGALIARVQLAVPRPAQLRNLRGFQEWNRGSSFANLSGYYTPLDNDVAYRPAMLTSTTLLFHIPAAQLHTPTDAPKDLTVRDAKAAIKRLGALLEERLAPVLKALD
ncbi:hypothetical protein [Actinocorallia libanotica]|uniref:Uncharacterized protein n=1 Tax=Actinocorallia libanotica TaxID=46162 RepID=A0ABN1RZZ1_9ACTN